MVMSLLAIWSFSGLPLHPLLVHAATVLVFLAAIAAVVLMLWQPEWRRRYTAPLAVICLGLLVVTQLTVMTGEQLADWTGEEKEIEDHEEAGEMARNMLALLTLGLAAVAMIERRESAAAITAGSGGTGVATDRRSLLSGAVRVGAGIAGLATLGTVYQAGHSGATAVWGDELKQGGESGEGGEGEGEE
jgi:hypothetical protein